MYLQEISKDTIAVLVERKWVSELKPSQVGSFLELETFGHYRNRFCLQRGDRVICLNKGAHGLTPNAGHRTVWAVINPESSRFGKVFMIDTSAGGGPGRHIGLQPDCDIS